MRKCDAAYRAWVEEGCLDALEAAGYVRFRRRNVDWPMQDGFACWVGLNTALLPDRVELLPFVGVHVEPVMRLCAAATGAKYDRATATYSVNLGALSGAGGEATFVFRPDLPVEAATDFERLARLYATVGLGYAQSIGTYGNLLPLLKGRVARLGGYPDRYVACLYLTGQIAQALTFVRGFASKHPDYFGEFAKGILPLLESQAG